LSTTVTTPRSLAFWQLIRTPETPALDQSPRAGVKDLAVLESALDRFVLDFAVERRAAERLRAAALLYHDHHNAAHDLVQDATDADGALLHAVVHRREPDFWNARYWFRQAADHPAYRRLTPRLGEWITPATAALAKRLTLSGLLDPGALVDACEEAGAGRLGGAELGFLRAVQHGEFVAFSECLLG
jgi:hypothetical protein